MPVVSLNSASLPTAVFRLPVVFRASASDPMAVLFSAVVFSLSASAPMAVLKLPVVLFLSAAAPNSGEMGAQGVHEAHSKTNGQVEVGDVVGERLRPIGHVKVAKVLLASAPAPTATLYWPVVSLVRAFKPTAVLLIPTAVLTSCRALLPSAVLPPG